MPEKKTSSDARGKEEMLMGIAWFRRDEWPKLLEVSADRDQLEDTYDEWLESARRTLLKLRAEGRRTPTSFSASRRPEDRLSRLSARRGRNGGGVCFYTVLTSRRPGAGNLLEIGPPGVVC